MKEEEIKRLRLPVLPGTLELLEELLPGTKEILDKMCEELEEEMNK